MPSKPKRPCKFSGCPALTDGRYCTEHVSQQWKLQEQKLRAKTPERAAYKRFYDSAEWRSLRERFLRDHPLCIVCKRLARVVDHITPISQGGASLDRSNLQSMCDACHNKKRQTERQS